MERISEEDENTEQASCPPPLHLHNFKNGKKTQDGSPEPVFYTITDQREQMREGTLSQ